MKITALIRPESVNANYRAQIPMVALQGRRHDVNIESAYSIVDAARLADRDVVHFCRLWEVPFQRLAVALRRRGVAVTWDSDDDLTSIPRGNPGYRRTGGFRGQKVFADMTAMMRLANVVTTPTEVLADLFRRASGADVRVIENYLAPPMIRSQLPIRTEEEDRVVVGWVAGNEHQVDVEQLRLRALFQGLLERLPELEIHSVGMRLGLPHRRYRYIRGVELLELVEVASRFDVGIAPIVDIPFNRARSNVKVKEYAAAGTPWLASALAPYDGLGEDEGGRLVDNANWEQEIERLVLDVDARIRLAPRAHAWGRRQDILRHALTWERMFADAIDAARRPVGVR